jgi:hypothetical protein
MLTTCPCPLWPTRCTRALVACRLVLSGVLWAVYLAYCANMATATLRQGLSSETSEYAWDTSLLDVVVIATGLHVLLVLLQRSSRSLRRHFLHTARGLHRAHLPVRCKSWVEGGGVCTGYMGVRGGVHPCACGASAVRAGGLRWSARAPYTRLFVGGGVSMGSTVVFTLRGGYSPCLRTRYVRSGSASRCPCRRVWQPPSPLSSL